MEVASLRVTSAAAAGVVAGCALILAVACSGPPEARCETRPGEGALAVECPPEDDWSERAEREAQEGFEDRAPGTR